MALGNLTKKQFLLQRPNNLHPNMSSYFMGVEDSRFELNQITGKNRDSKTPVSSVSDWSAVCYGVLHKRLGGILPTEFFIFMDKPNNEEKLRWAEYVVKEGWYSHIFTTQDMDEGYENGFEIDLTNSYTTILAALITLRWVIGSYCGGLDDWVKAGANKEAAIALSSIYRKGVAPIYLGLSCTHKLALSPSSSEHNPYNANAMAELFWGDENPIKAYDKQGSCLEEGTVNNKIWSITSPEGVDLYICDRKQDLIKEGIMHEHSYVDTWGDKNTSRFAPCNHETMVKIVERSKQKEYF